MNTTKEAMLRGAIARGSVHDIPGLAARMQRHEAEMDELDRDQRFTKEEKKRQRVVAEPNDRLRWATRALSLRPSACASSSGQ